VEEDGKAKVKIGKKTHSSEEIASYLIKHMLEEGRTYLKENGIDLATEKVTAMVTHPAYFQQNQVESIRDCVEKLKVQINDINIEEIKLIPEPMASICAAIYYEKMSKKDRYVLVIDEGAGTLDTTLVDMEHMNIGKEEEIEARGITIGGHLMLGGADMDDNILDWVLNELRKDENINHEKLKNIDKQALRKEVESAKIDISEGRTKVAQIRIPGFARLIELTESQLNSLILPVIMECKKTILESLNEIEKNHKIRREDITKNILVGGPTRMKNFRNMVNEILEAETVEINPMECVAIGAAISPTIHYQVPADRTYGLIKKDSGGESFVKAVPKDIQLPKIVVIPWKVEDFEGKIPIEVAQVLEERKLGHEKTEMVCLTMGKYEFSTPFVAKTYFIVFKLDDERKVEVIVTDSENRAEEYSTGISKEIQKQDFKVELRREIGIRVVEQNNPILPPRLMFFLNNAPGLSFRLKAANDILEKSKKIIEFGIEDSKLKEMFQQRTELEYSLRKIWQCVSSKLTEIGIENETITDDVKIEIKSFLDKLLKTDDYRELVMKGIALEKMVEVIKDDIYFDPNKIINLIRRISDTKTRALAKMWLLGNELSPKTIQEIESLLNELDIIQELLENRSEIFVNSVDGDIFRDGERKEQILKSIIDHRLMQDN
jgi:hypothetical protein